MSPQPDSNFPNTRWSLVLDAQGADSVARDRALEQICRTYWHPVYAFARAQGLAPSDAEDLTQTVLSHLLDKRAFSRLSADRGRLRSFLRVATKNQLRNQWRRDNAQKRGSGAAVLSLDWSEAEDRCQLEPADGESPDKIFDRNWGLNLLRRTMERLGAAYRDAGKGRVFEVLKDVLGQKGAGVLHRELAAELGMSESAVKAAVHRLRKRYRTLLKEEIAMTLDDPSPEAIDDEIRFLFGVFAS